MGVVFKAFDGALNRYVAIKMLSPNLAEMGAARKRFAREGQAAAAVIDDHVLPIYSVAEWQGVPYLVMQYSRGSTLQKRVEIQGPLELKEILRIGMQTARGLAAAHALGLVHRDVKPSNILIDDTVERALLTDFGLARAVDDASITRTGTIAGTPQYMSPEQARGTTVDARSDLFSLGGVLYFMATGRQPFRGDNSYAVLRLIIDQEPRSMQEINPDLPVWLCTLISHLMAKDPENRPASAEEVAEILQRCLAHVQQPAAVALPAFAKRSMKESRSGRRPWALSTRIVFALLVTLMAVSIYAGANVLRRFGAQTEASHATAAASVVAQHGPDITGLWFVKNGLDERFSIRPSTESSEILEISPVNGSPDLKWTAKWVADRKQFEGAAVLPGDVTGAGDITGVLRLSVRSNAENSQLDVALTFGELQIRRLRKSLSNDDAVPVSAEVRLVEVLDRLGHQTWSRRDPATLSQLEQPVTSDTRKAVVMQPVSDRDESAFRGFDSNAVSEGAGATWRKYVEWWNSTKGTPLETSAEIPRHVWATSLVRLDPKSIYSHGSNIVIVRSQDENEEEGIYVALAIASAHGPNDEQFTRTLIAHAPVGDVYTFRRKGIFKPASQTVLFLTDGASDPMASAAEPAKSLLPLDKQLTINAGLEYLARNQQKDGSWASGDDRGNVAVTALAGRAFLAAGDQPGHGANGARLTKAIEYILRNEDAGLLAEGRFTPMYEHGHAVHFLAEAFSKVTDKALQDRMKDALSRAVAVITDGQNREGGWRYRRTPRDADISVTCCQLQALAAAQRAGFDVPPTTIDKGIKYILSCRDLYYGDRFRYMPKVPSAPPVAFEYTAAAISSLKAAGYSGDKELLERGTKFIRSVPSSDVVDTHFYEARYDAAQVMKSVGGKDWDAWYSADRDDLLKRQNKDGGWGKSVPSSYSDTALALITLHSR